MLLTVKRPYDLRRWRKVAKQQLRDHPLCTMCLQRGEVVPATVVDHVVPHRRDSNIFWFGVLQSLCVQHHNGAKQQFEHRGYNTDIGNDGWPTDPKHPVYRTQKNKSEIK